MSEYQDDYFDDDEEYYYEDDYLYVEDSYAIADELAENAIPNPSHPEYLEDDCEDFDPFDYWMDEEYGPDGYYDIDINVPGTGQQMGQNSKRKRRLSASEMEDKKRRKTASNAFSLPDLHVDELLAFPIVRWLPTATKLSVGDMAVTHDVYPTYALLPDWRERFKDAPGFAASRPISTDMVTNLSRHAKVQHHEADEEDDREGSAEADEVHDNDDDDDDDDDMEDDDDSAIDPELLQRALLARLSSTGLGDADQGAFMQSIMQMLAGGGNANPDDIISELTTSILDQAAQGGADSATTQWLSQQGVSLMSNDDDNDAHSDATETEQAPRNAITNVSPRDSAVSVQSEASGRKRKAPPSSNTTLKRQNDATEIDETPPSQSEETRLASTVLTPTPSKAKTLRLSSTINSSATISSPSKGKQGPVAHPTAVPEAEQEHQEAHDTPPQTFPEPKTDQTVKQHKAPPPSSDDQFTEKKTRKRKATAEDVQPEAEQPKRKLRSVRSFAAPTASSQSKAAEPAKKTTRSGKQRK